MNEHIISHRLLSNFKQYSNINNKIQDTHLSSLLGVGILDNLTVRTHSYNRNYVKRYYKVKKMSSSKFFKKIRTYEHKTSEHLGLKTRIKIEEKENNLKRALGLEYPIQISLNPSKFRDASHMMGFLEKLLGESLPTALIWRVDCSVLLPIKFFPVEFFYLSLLIQEKRKFKKFLDHLPYNRELEVSKKSDVIESDHTGINGLQYGLYPSKVQIYNLQTYKAKNQFLRLSHQEILHKSHKIQLASFEDGAINIEIQNTAASLKSKGILRVKDIGSLSQLTPFDSFRFYNVINNDICNQNFKVDVLDFQISTLMNGFFHARKRINHQNNADWFINKNFLELILSGRKKLEDILNLSFKNGMNRFFKSYR